VRAPLNNVLRTLALGLFLQGPAPTVVMAQEQVASSFPARKACDDRTENQDVRVVCYVKLGQIQTIEKFIAEQTQALDEQANRILDFEERKEFGRQKTDLDFVVAALPVIRREYETIIGQLIELWTAERDAVTRSVDGSEARNGRQSLTRMSALAVLYGDLVILNERTTAILLKDFGVEIDPQSRTIKNVRPVKTP
jgi:hypothetical protein